MAPTLSHTMLTQLFRRSSLSQQVHHTEELVIKLTRKVKHMSVQLLKFFAIIILLVPLFIRESTQFSLHKISLKNSDGLADAKASCAEDLAEQMEQHYSVTILFVPTDYCTPQRKCLPSFNNFCHDAQLIHDFCSLHS